MTPTLEIPTAAIPARRRPSTAPAVLIRVPRLSPEPPKVARGPRRARRRRRLRREFRVAGCLLLATLPLSMAAFGLGFRPRAGLSVPAPESRADADSLPLLPRITLAPPEPIVAIVDPSMASASGSSSASASAPGRPDSPAPVFLGGDLLPVDEPQEPRDGGH